MSDNRSVLVGDLVDKLAVLDLEIGDRLQSWGSRDDRCACRFAIDRSDRAGYGHERSCFGDAIKFRYGFEITLCQGADGKKSHHQGE